MNDGIRSSILLIGLLISIAPGEALAQTHGRVTVDRLPSSTPGMGSAATFLVQPELSVGDRLSFRATLPVALQPFRAPGNSSAGGALLLSEPVTAPDGSRGTTLPRLDGLPADEKPSRGQLGDIAVQLALTPLIDRRTGVRIDLSATHTWPTAGHGMAGNRRAAHRFGIAVSQPTGSRLFLVEGPGGAGPAMRRVCSVYAEREQIAGVGAVNFLGINVQRFHGGGQAKTDGSGPQRGNVSFHAWDFGVYDSPNGMDVRIAYQCSRQARSGPRTGGVTSLLLQGVCGGSPQFVMSVSAPLR